MDTNSVNLMQYAVGGASLFILIAVGIIALFIKRMEARKGQEEDKTRKKEKASPLPKQSNKQPISPPQKMEQPKKMVHPKEVALLKGTKPKQQAEEMQELQQRQIMQRLRENQQRHVRQAMASPQMEQESSMPPSQGAQINKLVEPSQPLRQSQSIKESQATNKTTTLEVAFYKVQTTGRGDNKAFFLDAYLNVGRNEESNDWVIDDDPTVSSNHCRIYQKDGALYILDLNSTNGTYVNEERVMGEMRLENHDKIRMGQTEYRIRI